MTLKRMDVTFIVLSAESVYADQVSTLISIQTELEKPSIFYKRVSVTI